MNIAIVVTFSLLVVTSAFAVVGRILTIRKEKHALQDVMRCWGIRLPLWDYERVAVISRKRPGYDAWGSAVALSRALCKMGYSVDLFMDDRHVCSGVRRMLSDLKVTVLPADLFNAADYNPVYVVDCGDATRMCVDLSDIDCNQVDVVSIDHHGNGRIGTFELVDKDEASTSALVWLWLDAAEQGLGVSVLDTDTAAALLMGHLGDTSGLATGGTRALEAAVDLAESAGDAGIKRAWGWFTSRTAGELRIRACAEEQASRSVGDVISYALEQQDFERCGAGKSGLAGLAGELLEVEGFKYAVTVVPDKEKGDFDRWRISVRSQEGVVPDAQYIARQFGGDGHPTAAGCEVLCSDAQTALEAVNMVKACIATCRLENPLGSSASADSETTEGV